MDGEGDVMTERQREGIRGTGAPRGGVEEYAGLHDLYRKACRLMPGGVNSPVRSFRAVGGTPLPVRGGHGPRLVDDTGAEYLDLVMGWGSLILGHAHPEVRKALQRALRRGWNFGALTGEEVVLAELLCRAVSGVEMVRLVNSGTEAAMSAVRLARAFTGRSKVVRFHACYHGHADALLTAPGEDGFSSRPSSLGVPPGCVADTLTLPYGDEASLRGVFEAHGEEIAAVIVEPVGGNAGVVIPAAGFLPEARGLCDRWGALLIFDEVITGFRFRFGDCGEMLGVRPDLVCLGKIIGGGLPIGAYGGRGEIMELVAPLGGVYQAGTFSGNLASVTAGLATLEVLGEENPYPFLDELGSLLQKGLEEGAAEAGLEVKVHRFGSMLSLTFLPEAVGAGGKEQVNASYYGNFFHEMLKRGIYLPPSPSESWFLSTSHGEEDVRLLLEAAGEAFKEVRKRG